LLIHPQIPKGITWAKTFKETPYGKLVVNWELKEKLIELNVEIPVGSEAGVVIPSGIKKYSLDGKEYEVTGVASYVVVVKSGKYKINYAL